MSGPHKVIQPVKVGGKVLRAGADLDAAKVGEKRLARLVAKGRVAAPQPPVNRADTAGREAAPSPGAPTGTAK